MREGAKVEERINIVAAARTRIAPSSIGFPPQRLDNVLGSEAGYLFSLLHCDFQNGRQIYTVEVLSPY
jgi:hypothetical protein